VTLKLALRRKDPEEKPEVTGSVVYKNSEDSTIGNLRVQIQNPRESQKA